MARYSRILLKLSGELLREGGDCLAPTQLRAYAAALVEVRKAGVQVAVVSGGGNILRGRDLADHKDRSDVDHVGMLATILNVGMLRFYLEDLGQTCVVQAAKPVSQVAEPFHRRRAIEALEAGHIVLLGGGTGNPHFSTDSAAALRAVELGCDAVLKGTMVDGVYDADPKKNPQAQRFDELTFDEVLERNLTVMDQTAIALCRDEDLPVVVFDIRDPDNLLGVVEGKVPGTVIHGGAPKGTTDVG